jgi:hypothetical protein
MLLDDKVAVIYGAGGDIGGAIARAFAREGPSCFSPGATWHPSRRSPRTSWPPADSARRPRSTPSTSKTWTPPSISLVPARSYAHTSDNSASGSISRQTKRRRFRYRSMTSRRPEPRVHRCHSSGSPIVASGSRRGTSCRLQAPSSAARRSSSVSALSTDPRRLALTRRRSHRRTRGR